MSQNARVALWVPNTTPAVGDGVKGTSLPDSIKRIATQFAAFGSGGGGGGIEEAPIDSQTYGRRNAAWVVVTGGGGSGTVEEAPNTGAAFVRQSLGWTDLATVTFDGGTF
jgi:hypothetical protein